MGEGKARILVVEDDADINHLVCEILEKNGYDVTGAFSGTEAALRLERDAFDLLILDLMLPGMDGEQLLGTLSAQQRKQMMVLVLSARSALSDKVELLTGGADDYMTKPFEPEELLARAGQVSALCPEKQRRQKRGESGCAIKTSVCLCRRAVHRFSGRSLS
ncbi:MAG: response regulator transcription factor [Lachnospiraceae bacterium]